MGKRYYSFELLDPYTNVIDIPGLREDGGGAGSFVIRWSRSRARACTRWRPGDHVEVPPRLGHRPDAGHRPSDQRKAYELMSQYRLTGRPASARSFPKGCEPGTPRTVPDADRRAGSSTR